MAEFDQFENSGVAYSGVSFGDDIETADIPAKSKKRGTSPLDVVLVVLIALGVGYGASLVLGNEPEAQASPSPAVTADFLSSIIGEDSPASPPGANFPHIVFEDGTLFVRGIASSAEEVDETVRRLSEIFGEENIVAEYLVDGTFNAEPGVATSVYFADNVLFGSGSASIDPQFEDVLEVSAGFLQLSDDTTISISGHTDSKCTEESNLALSQARVDAARQAMIAAGGDPDRITAIGEGESNPIADNSTAAGRQQNRRVELTLNTMG